MTNTESVRDIHDRAFSRALSASMAPLPQLLASGLPRASAPPVKPACTRPYSPPVVAQYPCDVHTTRCVRFAYLDGWDPYTQKDYSHRRQWMEEHLLLLKRVFCIDVIALTIENDLYRMILSPNEREAQMLSNHEIICRWRMLYKGPKSMERYIGGKSLSRDDREVIATTAELWRGYLTSTSRFLGHLHQTIARKANMEDDCKGRFWEGRSGVRTIECQAELDEVLTEFVPRRGETGQASRN